MTLIYICRSIINKKFINIDELASGGDRILNLCELPRDYVAFTLYDPVFELRYSSDPDVRDQSMRNSEVKQNLREIFAYEETQLLA